MNPRFAQLQPYPFAKLRMLLADLHPNQNIDPLRLSIGEPEHKPPVIVENELGESGHYLRKYPPTAGSDELKTVIANWANSRFNLRENHLDPTTMILPCNGTREALFAITQTVVDPSVDRPLVMMPNPFYQIYEGAAVFAGAETGLINNQSATQLPDFDSVSDDEWRRCQLLFICTPGNPNGISLPLDQLKKLIRLADEFDFVIASDECYSELYLDESKPTAGLLEACSEMNRADFSRCLVFHSLSKRSNLAGLRSGFVAGDPELIAKFLLYRTYHGSAMSLQNQAASAVAWSDDSHVIENRALYRAKYEAICPMIDGKLDFVMPDAGFYLWLKTPMCDIEFATQLYEKQHLTVLPGSYLSRETALGNPGKGYIRLALVSDIESCIDGIKRLVSEV